jgi:hypothetical protein
MTWAKFRPEMATEAMRDQLSHEEFRLHVEGVLWLYSTEDDRLHIPRHMLRKISTVEDPENAATGLAKHSWWMPCGEDGWIIIHDAEVIRQSLARQWKHREDERNRQRAKRRKHPDVGPNVGRSVGTNVGSVSHPTQTNKQPNTRTGSTTSSFVTNPSTNGERIPGGVLCEQCGERRVGELGAAQTRRRLGRVLCSGCQSDAFLSFAVTGRP